MEFPCLTALLSVDDSLAKVVDGLVVRLRSPVGTIAHLKDALAKELRLSQCQSKNVSPNKLIDSRRHHYRTNGLTV